ncbi:MAG TPA: DUF202 domain-containing protein [Streptosporangiaceae bacterium]|nr:DUF202 domain-containing protein [Streptosporangiaceae bacterium]
MAPPDDPEEIHPGLARERTELAWTRTAVSFAAVGGAIIKSNLGAGLIVVGLSPVIWWLGRLVRDRETLAHRPKRMLLITVGVTAVALVTLAVVLPWT